MMIPQSRLEEFGFSDPKKFPQHLMRHAIMLSLPSAMERGIDPVEIVIEDGLAVPLQVSVNSSGMVIRGDGAMLYVAHRDDRDMASPLEVRFIREIPYDVRIEVSNIMRRAVLADPSLKDVWSRVSGIWLSWFPISEDDGAVSSAGEFGNIGQAWNGIGDLVSRLCGQVHQSAAKTVSSRLRLVVQSGQEFKKGWQGEEHVVDETDVELIIQRGRIKYLLQDLFPKMQKILRNPMFSLESTFRLYYGSRRAYIIKLVILPINDPGKGAADSAGIELTMPAVDGFPPFPG